LITSFFAFNIQGDGISTTFNITPWTIPQGTSGPNLPHLPLVGIVNSTALCYVSPFGTLTFTGTASGRQLIVTFPTPPPADTQVDCGATVLFHPQ
jgi:hypothetical protein